jgi:hypothetical protein
VAWLKFSGELSCKTVDLIKVAADKRISFSQEIVLAVTPVLFMFQ